MVIAVQDLVRTAYKVTTNVIKDFILNIRKIETERTVKLEGSLVEARLISPGVLVTSEREEKRAVQSSRSSVILRLARIFTSSRS